ncbi:MAG TPA: TSUP family transporter, partial [Candidatus Thermoplasmatota archaeon]
LVPVWINALVAAATQTTFGYGDAMLTLGVPLAVGALFGGTLGAWLSHRLPARPLQVAFALVLALVGLRFLV